MEVRKVGRYVANVMEDDFWLASDGAVAARGKGGKLMRAGKIQITRIDLSDVERAEQWYEDWEEYQGVGYEGIDPAWDKHMERRVEMIRARQVGAGRRASAVQGHGVPG